jgi:hypothetical protein
MSISIDAGTKVARQVPGNFCFWPMNENRKFQKWRILRIPSYNALTAPDIVYRLPRFDSV